MVTHSRTTPLTKHLNGHLKDPVAARRPIPVMVSLNSGSGLTSITEGLYARTQQRCQGKVLERPYTGGMTGQVTDERFVGFSRHTCPVHRPFHSAWGNLNHYSVLIS